MPKSNYATDMTAYFDSEIQNARYKAGNQIE